MIDSDTESSEDFHVKVELSDDEVSAPTSFPVPTPRFFPSSSLACLCSAF